MPADFSTTSAAMPSLSRQDRFTGLLLGTAVGDALGLPREMLSARRALRLFGPPPLRHQFFFGRGMTSDDTEHACMTAQALLRSQGDPDRFARELAGQLRRWLMTLPAGVGLATARSILRLYLFFPPHRAGVRSAGCGPAMRAPMIGAFAQDIDHLKALSVASCRLTHNHPTALDGALAVALAARYAMRAAPEALTPAAAIGFLRPHLSDAAILGMLGLVQDALERHLDAPEFAAAAGMKKGVSGYIVHVTGAALFCWLRYAADFRAALTSLILLGGDTDSAAAVCGALLGATGGPAAIPDEWLSGLLEYPRSVAWMRALAQRLADDAPPPALFFPALIPRNLFFLIIVLFHGFRRLLPPY